MHRVFQRGFNFGLFSVLFSFFFFQNNKKRHKNTQRCWSATHSAPPVINAKRHSDLTAPQRGGEELKWGNPSKSGFCAPVLFMSAAEVNETMRAWNSLMEPVCFQPWLFLKEAKIRGEGERFSALKSYGGLERKLSLRRAEEPHGFTSSNSASADTYRGGYIKTLWLHSNLGCREGSKPVKIPLLFLEFHRLHFEIAFRGRVHPCHSHCSGRKLIIFGIFRLTDLDLLWNAECDDNRLKFWKSYWLCVELIRRTSVNNTGGQQ